MLLRYFVVIVSVGGGSVAGDLSYNPMKDFYTQVSVPEELDYNALLGYGNSVYGSLESDRSNLGKPVASKPSLGKPVKDDYQITSELGTGTFGAVYRAISKAGGWPVALKMETRAPPLICLAGHSPKGLMSLEYEYGMMRLMQGVPGFPQLYGGSFDSIPQHYVMELLGVDLKSYLGAQPGHVVERTKLVGLAHQMVDRLEAMHERGIVMYDIHLKNFLIHKEVVYVIDLAIAHKMNDRCPIRDFCTQPAFGIVSSSSYATDDVRRLMYLLAFLARGTLPWLWVADSLKPKVKAESKARDVCAGRAGWLLEAYEYVESLTPGSAVDYGRLKKLIG